MCGIAFLWNNFNNIKLIEIWTQVLNDISYRGPDLYHHMIHNSLEFAGAVLHIQGNEITRQPLIDNDGNILLWNGEVFGGIERVSNISDTQMISLELALATRNLLTLSEIGSAITEKLSQVEGPYAFIYFHASSQSIFYGRDPFGRRSLIALSQKNDQESLRNHLLLASVCLEMDLGDNYLIEELPVSGVFCLSLNFQPLTFHFPWPEARIKLQRLWDQQLLVNPNTISLPAERFLFTLKNIFTKRIRCVHSLSADQTFGAHGTCSIGVLFSGGIDSVLLAAVLHLSLPESMNSLSIDLLNVTFEGQSSKPLDLSPDRLAAIAALGELELLFPQRTWRLVHIDVSASERNNFESRIFGLIQPLKTHMDLNIGTAFWFASRGEGYLRQYTPEEYKEMYQFEENGRPLLRLGEDGARRGKGQKQRVPESDGQNIPKKIFCSRERCRKVSKPGCPHILCRTCCEKLQNENRLSAESETLSCPVHRRITGNEESDRNTTNKHITSGEEVEKDCQPIPVISYPAFKSNCKILLVGIGADEQMAGYGRHRTTFEKFGWEGLVNELHSDMTRLWTRNLGRDDRCASDHGRELWFPFLDEEMVQLLQHTPINEICNLTLPYGIGDKKILRDAGKLIGLTNSTELVKRAIQFGTRVAKHTNVKYHGSNRKGKGTTEIEYDES